MEEGGDDDKFLYYNIW